MLVDANPKPKVVVADVVANELKPNPVVEEATTGAVTPNVGKAETIVVDAIVDAMLNAGAEVDVEAG